MCLWQAGASPDSVTLDQPGMDEEPHEPRGDLLGSRPPVRERDHSKRCQLSVCPSQCEHSLVLTLFPWSCGEGLGKKKQNSKLLINTPENRHRRTTPHLATGAVETQVMGLTPLHQGAWHSTCPQPFPKPLVGAGGHTLVLFVTQPNHHLQSLPGSCGQELGPWGKWCPPASRSPPGLKLLQLLLQAR